MQHMRLLHLRYIHLCISSWIGAARLPGQHLMNRKKKVHLYSPENRTLIRKIFTQRRKQIGSITKKEDKEVQTKLYQWMKKNEIAQSSRPEEIEPFIWQTLP